MRAFTSILLTLLILAPTVLPAQENRDARREIRVREMQQAPLPDAMSEDAFAVLSRFFDYDRSVPLNARVVAKQDHDGFAREKIVFSGWDGSRVPGYLALPAKGSPPFPVVLLGTPLNGGQEMFWRSGQPGGMLTESLLESGIAVLTLDAPYHGERLGENGFEPPAELILNRQNHRLRDLSVQAVIEQRRALDYLASRGDIDTTRIGLLGFSMGAMHALYLGAVEPRVEAAVVWATPLRKEFPALYPGHFARRIRDPAVLMLAGRSDPFYTLEEAKTLFGLIPSREKEFVAFEAAHQLRPEELPLVVDWLAAQLGVVP